MMKKVALIGNPVDDWTVPLVEKFLNYIIFQVNWLAPTDTLYNAILYHCIQYYTVGRTVRAPNPVFFPIEAEPWIC